MTNADESRRKYLTISAVNPIDGTLCEVQISQARMVTVGKRSMAHAKECAFLVPEILQGPTAVFEGLRSDEDEDHTGCGWRCYCGIPSQAYHPDGTKRAAYPNQVYLVFVNDENVAYNWRWERSDDDDSKLPVDYNNRFRKRLI